MQKALDALGGPNEVVLAENCAYVPAELDDEQIKAAVAEAGYQVVNIA